MVAALRRVALLPPRSPAPRSRTARRQANSTLTPSESHPTTRSRARRPKAIDPQDGSEPESTEKNSLRIEHSTADESESNCGCHEYVRRVKRERLAKLRSPLTATGHAEGRGGLEGTHYRSFRSPPPSKPGWALSSPWSRARRSEATQRGRGETAGHAKEPARWRAQSQSQGRPYSQAARMAPPSLRSGRASVRARARGRVLRLLRTRRSTPLERSSKKSREHPIALGWLSSVPVR